MIAYFGVGMILLFVPDLLNTELWKYMYPYFVVGYLWNAKKVDVTWLNRYKGIITTVLIAAFAILFGYYSTDAFIYTTGIAVRSVNQLVIDLYRYAIGFVGSAMIIWITYMLYPVISQKLPVVCKSLVYCGRISLLIYIIDCLINAYILPRITKDFSPNYVIACVETLVSMVFIIGIDWLIKKIPLARKLLLGNR